MDASKKPHVLVVSLPYQGHINPMIRFAEILVSKGLNVTIVTMEYGRKRILNESIQQNLFEFAFIQDGLAIEFDRDKNLDILLEEYLPRKGVKNLSSLISNYKGKGKEISCIVNNCFVPWVADVANDYRIPCAMLWVQSCATYAIFYHYYKRLSRFPSFDRLSDTVEISGLPLLKVEDLPTFFLASSPAHFRNVISTTINNLEKFQWIFGSSFHGLEEKIVNSMNQHQPILPIGPLVTPTMLLELNNNEHGDTDLCMDWLNKQNDSSVIYIALGSISVLSQSDTEALAHALESNSAIRFLWVMKKGEEGWGRKMGNLPPRFLEKTKHRGIVVPWCRQDKVLMHPSISCFLTHCGWNSTLEAILAGIPVITYPDWTDQVTNAKLLVDVFNMGVRMKKIEDVPLMKEEIERCIAEVTKGPGAMAMKEQAIKWKVAAKKARSIGGTSDDTINEFVNSLSGE